MSRDALGLIETKGLIAAIEATDAAAKAAAVVIASVELTDATFMTIKIEGDLGAVQAAVQAGAEAAENVGELVAVHVIPRPDEGLVPMLPRRRYESKYRPHDDRPPLGYGSAEPDLPAGPRPPSAPGGNGSMTLPAPAPPTAESLQRVTVTQLRRYARQLVAIKRVLGMD